jgi:hypothetical protein
MSLPNVPTDNLYKFIALSGVLIILSSSYLSIQFIFDSSQKIRELNMDISIYYSKAEFIVEDIEDLRDSNPKWDNEEISELNYLIKEQRKLLLEKIEVEEKKKELNRLDETTSIVIKYWLLVLFISIAMMIYGFSKWYTKVQRFLDKKLKKESEK